MNIKGQGHSLTFVKGHSDSTFSNFLCSIDYYQVCSNDAPGLTLTYFTARSDLVPYSLVWEKVKTMDFPEIIVVYDIKVGTL